MASKSATLLAFFVIAIIAFCLACVCAAMTGPIDILPVGNDTNDTDLFNFSNIEQSYGSPDDDGSSSQSSSSSSNDYGSQSSQSIDHYSESSSTQESSESSSESSSDDSNGEQYSE